MNLLLRSILVFGYSLGVMAMMSGGGGHVAALPWKASAFDARSQNPEPAKVAVKTNETQHLLTVVFDMDETLLWQRSTELQEPVYRHGVLELLAHLSGLKSVQMILWTASVGSYVHDELRPFFHRIITRDDGNWFEVHRGGKPLRILSGVHPERVVMFDDRTHSIHEDQHRALLVHAFHGPSGLEHQPDIDSKDLTHKHIRELVGYLLSQIEGDKTVPEALMAMASTSRFLEWHYCEVLSKRFLRVPKTHASDDDHFVVHVASEEAFE